MRTLKQTRGKPAGKGRHSLLKGPKSGDDTKTKSGKSTSTKNKIRGVERLLRKAVVDNKLKRSLDAKLCELRDSLNKHNQEEIERKFAIRYHKIRFFERVKLERRIKQLKGKAQRGHALSASEQQQIQKWEQDLQYVLHFPKGERYVSILKEAAEPEAQTRLDAERARLKALIKQQLAENAMLTEADEGLGQAEPPTLVKPDAEGDTFFLDSEDEQSSEEELASSAKPAAGVAVLRSKRGRGEVSAKQAQQGVAQQAQKGRAQQQQQSIMAQQAKNGAAPHADGATRPVGIHDQPFAKRQALTSSAQTKIAAPKRVSTSNTANASGIGSAQQYPQHNCPLVLQPSHHAVQYSPQAQPMHGPTSSARSNEKLDQSAREVGSTRQKSADRSRAISTVDKAAKITSANSAASRSQLLLQQLQQKYAKPQPDKGSMSPMKALNRKSKDIQQVSKLTDNCPQSLHADRPQLSKAVCGKSTAVRQMGLTTSGAMPTRTRAEGGRKRRK